MSDKTKIEWTDATWNPVTGCTKVSQGCKHCYAEREWPRLTKLVPAYAGRDFTDVRTHADRLDQPLRWKRPRRVFVNSMSDLFHESVPDEFIDRVFAVMALAHQHTFQVLTKRADRMRDYFNAKGRMVAIQNVIDDMETWDGKFIPSDQSAPLIKDWPLPNVWLGVSVEDQATADERIPLLLQTSAAVRWISAEPLLGAMTIDPIFLEHYGPGAATVRGLDWVVVGGESGPKARPMNPQWARDLRDQCAASGVPFLFKQWGEWAPRRPGLERDGLDGATRLPALNIWPCGYIARSGAEFEARPPSTDGVPHQTMWRVVKRAAGRLLDGVQHNGYPEARP